MDIRLIKTCLGALICLSTANAGHMVSASNEKIVRPEETRYAGQLTIGGQASKQLWTGYADALCPLWSLDNALVFLDASGSFDDSSQTTTNVGLGMRYLIPDSEIILGGNIYYDRINSAYGNDYNELGFGVEVLTHWIDARFNYYLPESGQDIADSRRVEATTIGNARVLHLVPQPVITNSGIITPIWRIVPTDIHFEGTTNTRFNRYEAGLEGWNSEIGFLVPGLDRFAEVRLLAGYYHYNNPFGSDYEGFKVRAEARLLPGLIADVEWWDDAALMGGHWTGGLRASVPFSFGNLFQGKNPFEGAADAFTPGKRPFAARMTEMVIRSHRVKTATSGFVPVQTSRRAKITINRQSTVTLDNSDLLNDLATQNPTIGGGTLTIGSSNTFSGGTIIPDVFGL